MDPIKIESKVPVEKINHIIKENPIEKDIDMKYEEHENRIRYTFSLNKDHTNKLILLKSLSKIAYEIINKYYIDDIIKLNIDKKLGEVDPKSKSEILEDVKDVLISNNLFTKEKDDIVKEIYEYFLEDDTLIIDGYLNFRAKSIHDLIDKVIELVLGDFQVGLDYGEFIDMLKTIARNQVSEVKLVNVTLEDEKYSILDKDLNEIENEEINQVLKEISPNQVSDIDIVLSILITLNPENIIIHLGEKEEDELASILEEIFEDRLKICRDCKLCKK